jgi:hypothetical protein
LVQNGAGSGVGRAVIQLAAARGVRSVNILRDRRAAHARIHTTTLGREASSSLYPDVTADRLLLRRRPGFEAAADELRALGATLVVRPDELRRSGDAAAALRALPPPKLGARPLHADAHVPMRCHGCHDGRCRACVR